MYIYIYMSTYIRYVNIHRPTLYNINRCMHVHTYLISTAPNAVDHFIREPGNFGDGGLYENSEYIGSVDLCIISQYRTGTMAPIFINWSRLVSPTIDRSHRQHELSPRIF